MYGINGTKVECKVDSVKNTVSRAFVLMEPKWNVKNKVYEALLAW